ncbi:coatomer subunit beta'-2 isoform X1 [Daucus carota subsp. sativus]|uniref:coatomer subunit beta'-2 isoform X1 n=1 Tax=Daucus carota subsp. sativus TaxID=79200 RepID=UPI0007EFE7FD|nr:PREDICTED: coatomer subunit beta'-2-like isoform X2 [Daucus carota subsp. sativus]
MVAPVSLNKRLLGVGTFLKVVLHIKETSEMRTTKINQKAAEPLADPEDYPNLFEDWQLALGIESKVAEIRNTIPPAAKYVNHMHKSNVNRLEAFRNMYVDEEEPHQNGDLDHE